VARPLNEKPKYVVSRSLSEPLGWDNARLLHGDVGEAVAGLKQEDGGDLLVIGSAELLRTLTGHDLVDEFRVMIDPLLLGGGKGFFPDDGVLRSLRLVDSKVTSTGAILATYARAEG
jgi:dihydrofolate reductase